MQPQLHPWDETVKRGPPCVKIHHKAQELCESRGGRPGLPAPNSPYGLCGRKATLNLNVHPLRPQELCESRSGRPGLPVPNKPDGFCGRKATMKLKRNK